jgi:ubiquinone/menaquinone biosynthesis C-methylase UbiE
MNPTNTTSQPLPDTGGFLDLEDTINEFNISEGMNIANFGCGAGYFTVYLAQKTGPGGNVYAIDVQESALDSVRSKAKLSGVSNIEAIRADLEVLSSSKLLENSQDIVLMANILFQSNKKENILKEGMRILKNGGELVIVEWKKDSGSFGPPNDLRLDEKELSRMAEGLGFKSERSIRAGKFHFGIVFKKA